MSTRPQRASRVQLEKRHRPRIPGPERVVLTEHLSVKADVLVGLCEPANGDQPDGAVPTSPSPSRPPRQVQRRFTAAETVEIREQYLAGQTMNQLASSYSVHRRTIAHCLQKQAVHVRQVGLPAEHLDQAAMLYRCGWSLARIGGKYGTTDMTVRRALAKHGVEIQPRNGFG
jgi:hypothetical protein